MAQPTYTNYLKLTKPSPDDYYDVQTWNSNMDALDAGVKSAKRCKTATVLIGTTSAGHTAQDCDVLCDGTNDAGVIMAQTNASGKITRRVVLLEGTYNLKKPLYISSNVILEGMGQNITILKRGFSSGAVICYENMAYYESPYNNYLANAAIRNLTVDGQRSTYTSTGNVGIYYNGTSDLSNIELSNVTIRNCYKGVTAAYSSRLHMQNCILTGCFQGVYLMGAGGVTVENCTLEGDNASGSAGITMDSICHTFRFAGNRTSRFRTHYYVEGKRGTAEGNHLYLEGDQTGISLYGNNAELVSVRGNRIKCTSSTAVGIRCYNGASKCLVSQNNIFNVSGGALKAGIYSASAASCSFLGNQIDCANGGIGIQIESGTGHQVANNAIIKAGTAIQIGTASGSSVNVPARLSLSGNQILEASGYGIYMQAQYSNVSGNLITMAGTEKGSIVLHAPSGSLIGWGCYGNLVAGNMLWGGSCIQNEVSGGNTLVNNKTGA